MTFAPDGIESFVSAKARSLSLDIFRIANLRDIGRVERRGPTRYPGAP